MQVLQDAQLQIARRLHAAFPAELDEVNGALQVLYADGVEQLRQRLRHATTIALRPGC